MRPQGDDQEAPLIQIVTFLELGLAGLKGKLELTPSEEVTVCKVFLRTLFISNKQSDYVFKHLLHNPFIEEDEEVSNVSVSQISHKYLGTDLHHKFLDLGRGVKPQTDIDFKPFKSFNPATELLSMNN